MLTTFFSVLMGAFALGQAGPSFQTLTKAQVRSDGSVYVHLLFVCCSSVSMCVFCLYTSLIARIC